MKMGLPILWSRVPVLRPADAFAEVGRWGGLGPFGG